MNSLGTSESEDAPAPFPSAAQSPAGPVQALGLAVGTGQAGSPMMGLGWGWLLAGGLNQHNRAPPAPGPAVPRRVRAVAHGIPLQALSFSLAGFHHIAPAWRVGTMAGAGPTTFPLLLTPPCPTWSPLHCEAHGYKHPQLS